MDRVDFYDGGSKIIFPLDCIMVKRVVLELGDNC